MTVVEHHNVMNDVLPGLLSRLVIPPVHPFRFHRSKKAFPHRIVPAAPFRLMLPSMPCALSNRRKARLVYWTPRSER